MRGVSPKPIFHKVNPKTAELMKKVSKLSCKLIN
jgi:hypothetical protein